MPKRRDEGGRAPAGDAAAGVRWSRGRAPAAALAALLLVATLALYWRIGGNEFLNYDDNIYVTANENVRAGLTGRTLAWAFTSVDAANWHPLTWLSHMLDVASLRAATPRGHHLHNARCCTRRTRRCSSSRCGR